MAAKKNNYINTDLDWAEKQLQSWKEYMDDNPFHKLKDRVVGKVTITIETQGKYLQDTMKNFLALLEVVDGLREKEEAKNIDVRGKEDLSPNETGELDD